MKKFLSLILIMSLCTFCFAACGGEAIDESGSKTSKSKVAETSVSAKTGSVTSATAESEKSTDKATSTSETPVVKITVKNYGEITLKLDKKQAPITVENFVDLAESGFYNGLTFHRIIKGFMIQGGDPLGNGTGGSDKTIKGEFSSNNVNNTISHKRGVISMARSVDPDSASSQFFICHKDAKYLDGEYAAFGRVISGMDVVDKIATDAKPIDDNGTILANEQPVIEKIEVLK